MSRRYLTTSSCIRYESKAIHDIEQTRLSNKLHANQCVIINQALIRISVAEHLRSYYAVCKTKWQMTADIDVVQLNASRVDFETSASMIVQKVICTGQISKLKTTDRSHGEQKCTSTTRYQE